MACDFSGPMPEFEPELGSSTRNTSRGQAAAAPARLGPPRNQAASNDVAQARPVHTKDPKVAAEHRDLTSGAAALPSGGKDNRTADLISQKASVDVPMSSYVASPNPKTLDGPHGRLLQSSQHAPTQIAQHLDPQAQAPPVMKSAVGAVANGPALAASTQNAGSARPFANAESSQSTPVPPRPLETETPAGQHLQCTDAHVGSPKNEEIEIDEAEDDDLHSLFSDSNASDSDTNGRHDVR